MRADLLVHFAGVCSSWGRRFGLPRSAIPGGGMSVVAELATALQWRCRHVMGKVLGRRRHIPWSLLLAEISKRHELQWETPGFAAVEEDRQAGLVALEA